MDMGTFCGVDLLDGKCYYGARRDCVIRHIKFVAHPSYYETSGSVCKICVQTFATQGLVRQHLMSQCGHLIKGLFSRCSRQWKLICWVLWILILSLKFNDLCTPMI